MADRIVFLNGSYVPEAEAKVSIFDEGLMYGSTVFEMTRSFNQQHFQLKEHIERLYQGFKVLRIPEPMTVEQMMELCDEVTLKNCPAFDADDEFRLMINVSRGPLGIYRQAVPQDGPTVCISCFPLKWTVAGMGRLFDDGINAVTVSQRHTDCLPNVKHRSRLHFVLANQEAAQVAGDRNWAVLLDQDGYVAEGTGANILLADENVVYSPNPDHCLKGISRNYVLDTAYNMDVHVQFDRYNLFEVLTSREVWFTGTPFCLLPVTSVNGIPIGDGKPGPLYKQFLERWSQDVNCDIKAQIQAWDAARVGPVGSSPYRVK